VWNSGTSTWSRPLDRKFLRVCAVYRLLKKRVIGRARAIELLAQRHTPREMKTLRATVSLWPIPDVAP
jgi:hypothetical protein